MLPYALIGTPDRRSEFLRSVSVSPPTYVGNTSPTRHDLEAYRLLIDLNLDEEPNRLTAYAPHPDLTVIGCAVRKSLTEMGHEINGQISCTLLGLNALPTFIDRPMWEMSKYHTADINRLEQAMTFLGLEYALVRDQVGMVTPRTLFLIINEAFAVMEEGTASAQDIDLAMRLGTNYPQGPLEWSQAIGLSHIVAVLERLQQLTGAARFAPNALLRDEMMRISAPPSANV